MPTSGAALKREVKFWSNTVQGIPTQCVVGVFSLFHAPRYLHRDYKIQRAGKFDTQKAGGPMDQYCNNVALKYELLIIETCHLLTWFRINARLGGITSRVDPKASGLPSWGTAPSIMIVGMLYQLVFTAGNSLMELDRM